MALKFTKICVSCNNSFQVWNYQLKTKKCCSNECAYKLLRGGKERLKLNCPVCEKPVSVPLARVNRGTKIYCSKGCSYKGRRKRVTKTCLSCGTSFEKPVVKDGIYCSVKCFTVKNQGASNYLWKGEKATYRSKHSWMIRMYGKATSCDFCGLKEIPKGKKRYFDWANISGEYLRERVDWLRLCRPCHRQFDSGKRHKT